jgi:hypothetical protein
MSEHTKEPWVLDQQSEIPIVMTSSGYAIVETCPWGSIRDQDEIKANARRIVACVNRLAQFKTEDIENPSYESGMYGVLAHVTRQRDDLLQALIGVMTRCEGSGYIGQDGQYLKEVRAAIAKAQP